MFKQLKDNLKVNEDGTYTRLGNPTRFDTGYQVSFERPDDNYSDDLFDSIVLGLVSALQSDVFVGVWGGSKELSFHTNDKAMALAVAFKYNQDAIWDWANGQAITLK